MISSSIATWISKCKHSVLLLLFQTEGGGENPKRVKSKSSIRWAASSLVSPDSEAVLAFRQTCNRTFCSRFVAVIFSSAQIKKFTPICSGNGLREAESGGCDDVICVHDRLQSAID